MRLEDALLEFLDSAKTPIYRCELASLNSRELLEIKSCTSDGFDIEFDEQLLAAGNCKKIAKKSKNSRNRDQHLI